MRPPGVNIVQRNPLPWCPLLRSSPGGVLPLGRVTGQVILPAGDCANPGKTGNITQQRTTANFVNAIDPATLSLYRPLKYTYSELPTENQPCYACLRTAY